MTLAPPSTVSLSPSTSAATVPHSHPGRSITPEIINFPLYSHRNIPVLPSKMTKTVSNPKLEKERITSKAKHPHKTKCSDRKVKAQRIPHVQPRREIEYQDLFLPSPHAMQVQQDGYNPPLSCLGTSLALEQQFMEGNVCMEMSQTITKAVISDAIAVLLVDKEHSTHVLLKHQNKLLNKSSLTGIVPLTHQVLLATPCPGTSTIFSLAGHSLYTTPLQLDSKN